MFSFSLPAGLLGKGKPSTPPSRSRKTEHFIFFSHLPPFSSSGATKTMKWSHFMPSLHMQHFSSGAICRNAKPETAFQCSDCLDIGPPCSGSFYLLSALSASCAQLILPKSSDFFYLVFSNILLSRAFIADFQRLAFPYIYILIHLYMTDFIFRPTIFSYNYVRIYIYLRT